MLMYHTLGYFAIIASLLLINNIYVDVRTYHILLWAILLLLLVCYYYVDVRIIYYSGLFCYYC